MPIPTRLKGLLSAVLILLLLFLATDVSRAAIFGDVNSDGRVDIVDIGLVIDNYGRIPITNPKTDLNTDGKVDIVDIGIVIDNYGETVVTPTATPTRTQLPSGNGVWISQNEIIQRPTSGAAWNAVFSAASGSWGSPSVANQDSNHDQMVLAGAYVCARTGQHCDKTVQGLLSAIGTESGARWLAIGRNMLGYTIAADVMRNSGHLSGSDLDRVSNWINSFITRTLADNNGGGQEVNTPFESGSNASAQEGAVYAAIAKYGGNTTKLNYVWNRFRLYSCDKTNNPEQTINIDNGFEGGWSHASTKTEACAINPKGSTKNSHSIDGAPINDIVRGGAFTWPPGPTQYVWTGYRGYIDAAVLLQRAGFPALAVKDNAPLRTIQYICYLQTNTPGGWWRLSDSDNASHLAKKVYGWNAPSGCDTQYPTGQDMILGFTDWTHP